MQATEPNNIGRALWFDPQRGPVPLIEAFAPPARACPSAMAASRPVPARWGMGGMAGSGSSPHFFAHSGGGADAPRNAPPAPAPDDDVLMCRVQDGEPELLAALFDRYQAPLLNFYLRMLGNRAASEDLVQEVFVRILKYRKTYRPGSRFSTWMYSIARNVRLDYVRKRAGLGVELEWEDGYAPAVVPADAVEAAQNRRLLELALARLPEAKREVLVLSRFHGLRYEQIGELLNCDPGTVKVRVHRALQELRHLFQQLAQGANV